MGYIALLLKNDNVPPTKKQEQGTFGRRCWQLYDIFLCYTDKETYCYLRSTLLALVRPTPVLHQKSHIRPKKT